MRNKIIAILEKYDIDEYHWKLEIADEIMKVVKDKRRKRLIAFCKHIDKVYDHIIGVDVIDIYLNKTK